MGFLLLAGAGIASSAERTDARAQVIAQVIAQAIQGGQPHPVASDSRVGGDDAQTRFVMDFSQKVDLRAFTLADPYRVVIDLPQVTFNLPPKTGETGRGLVKAFRFGLVMQGGSRIVMTPEELLHDSKEWMKANPGKTLVGALAAGYILGRLLRRR
jgi:hypothetical protein